MVLPTSIEVRQVDRPNNAPFAFDCPPNMRSGADLRRLISTYDSKKQLSGAAELIIRVFDERQQHYIVQHDNQPLPPGKTLRIALQRARPSSTSPLSTASTQKGPSPPPHELDADQQHATKRIKTEHMHQPPAIAQQTTSTGARHASQAAMLMQRGGVAPNPFAHEPNSPSPSKQHRAVVSAHVPNENVWPGQEGGGDEGGGGVGGATRFFWSSRVPILEHPHSTLDQGRVAETQHALSDATANARCKILQTMSEML